VPSLGSSPVLIICCAIGIQCPLGVFTKIY